jgi:tRNA pseudouridine38-40 synthase
MAENPGTASQVRLAFRIGYIGTSFSGSQFQPDKRTVEGEIEAACTRAGLIDNRKKARLALSGRTDRGVHARCQILAFSTTKPDLAVRALNGQLPPDIWVNSWSYAPPDFYPRYDIINRTYRFYFSKNPSDYLAMKNVAPLFLGYHDFTCFARIEPGKRPEKSIDRIEMNRDKSGCWVEITANSFLWHMVRCIASALFDISEGYMTIPELERCLTGKCKNKVKPAPPDGLILWDVATGLPWSEITLPDLKSRKIAEKAEYHLLMGRVYSLLVE